MKRFLLIFILLASFLQVFAQKKSLIYNQSGKLIADTTYSINKKQLRVFKLIEDTLVTRIISRVRYPEIEYEAYLGDSLIVISFTIKHDSITNEKIEKVTGKGRPGLGKMTLWVLQKYPPYIGHNISKGLTDKKYYLAFRFIPNGEKEKVFIKKGIITIMKPKLKSEESIHEN